MYKFEMAIRYGQEKQDKIVEAESFRQAYSLLKTGETCYRISTENIHGRTEILTIPFYKTKEAIEKILDDADSNLDFPKLRFQVMGMDVDVEDIFFNAQKALAIVDGEEYPVNLCTVYIQDIGFVSLVNAFAVGFARVEPAFIGEKTPVIFKSMSECYRICKKYGISSHQTNPNKVGGITRCR